MDAWGTRDMSMDSENFPVGSFSRCGVVSASAQAFSLGRVPSARARSSASRSPGAFSAQHANDLIDVPVGRRLRQAEARAEAGDDALSRNHQPEHRLSVTAEAAGLFLVPRGHVEPPGQGGYFGETSSTGAPRPFRRCPPLSARLSGCPVTACLSGSLLMRNVSGWRRRADTASPADRLRGSYRDLSGCPGSIALRAAGRHCCRPAASGTTSSSRTRTTAPGRSPRRPLR